MTGNLPDRVSITDSDAPWNQDYPEPDWQCSECSRFGLDSEINMQNPTCPECGAEVTRF